MQMASTTHRRIDPKEDKLPYQPPFRLLTMYLQIYDGDLERTLKHFESMGEIHNDEERRLFLQRARCAWHWIEHYAPEDFRYRIRGEAVQRQLSPDEKIVIGRLHHAFEENSGMDEKTLVETLKGMTEGTELAPKDVYGVIYDLLLNRSKGPKLSTLLITMGLDRAASLLAPSLTD